GAVAHRAAGGLRRLRPLRGARGRDQQHHCQPDGSDHGTLLYRIRLGSQSDSHGNATRNARRTTSAHMNGITPLNTVPVLTSGSSVRSTNMFIPTGGLINPISTTHT